MNLNLTKITDYLLIYLLIAFSGVPFFYRADISMMLAVFIFPLWVFIYRKRKLDKFIIVYVLVALFVQFLQMLKFSYLPAVTFMGLHLRILFAYTVLRSVGVRSVDYYIDVLVVSVLISFFFYSLSYISAFETIMVNKVSPMFDNPLIKSRLYKVWPNVIVYTFNSKGEGLTFLKRNSGPFWEPGAFAGFLTIAILFQFIRSGALWSKKGNILMLGLLSTFSTTGIVALFFVIVSFIFSKMKIGERLIFVPIVLIGFIITFQSVDFLGKKIKAKMSYDIYTYNTRFKSAAIDLKDFAENPLVGVGRSSVTRYQGGVVDSRDRHRNNGVTNHLAMYGIFYFLAYFYLIYLGFRQLCVVNGMNKNFALLCIAAIFLIGFSEIYFNKVFFYALTLIYFIYSKVESQVPLKSE